jgi:acetyltransferase-like isoleucine patch superfamily enzyme
VTGGGRGPAGRASPASGGPTPAPRDVPRFLAEGTRPGPATAIALLARRARLRVRWGQRIELASGAVIGRDVRLRLGRGARLVLGPGAWLGDRSVVRASGEVRIGAGTLIGPESVLAATERVTIGENCLLGDEVMLNDTALTVGDATRPDGERPTTVQSIEVGDRARIGPRACLMAGAKVEPGASIGPREVVNAGGWARSGKHGPVT